MAPIVNPYLKKNQTPRVGSSATAGGEGVTPSHRSNGRAPHVSNTAPRSDVTGTTAAAKKQPLPSTKPSPAGFAPGASKNVTPGKNMSVSLRARSTITTPRPKLGGLSSHVTPGSNNTYAKSLKQKLKQEIQFLKLKKQNTKAQKEAEERRRKIQAEKDQLERQRQAQMAVQEKERHKAAGEAEEQRRQVQLFRVQQQQQQAEPVAIEPQRQNVKDEMVEEKNNPQELERSQEEEERVQRLLREKQQQDLHVWHAKKEEHQKAQMQNGLAGRAWREQRLLIQQQQRPVYGLPQPNVIVPNSNPSYNKPLPAALYDSFGGRYEGMSTGGLPVWNQNQYHHPFSFATHFGPAWGVANYGSAAFNTLMRYSSNPPPPPPLMPVVPRIRQQPRPRCNVESPMGPLILCSPLDHPSPFAHEERNLLTVPVVRHVENEPSFGVNLNLQKISTLVDPDWFWKERQRRLTMRQSQQDEPKEEPSNGGVLPNIIQPSSSLSETTDQVPTIKDNIPLSKDMAAHTPHQAKPDSIANEPTNASLPKASVGDEKVENSESKGLTVQEVSDATPGPNTTVPELMTTNKQESIDIDASVKNLASEASVVLESTTPVARRRRRRMDFAVMAVAEAEKQNARRPHASKEEKLEPGDIIISIGGQKIADLTFQDACSLFATKTEKVEKRGVLEVQVVVARKKPVPLATPAIESLSKSPAFADSPLHRPVNTSMDFTPTEIAFLADCVRKWLDDPCRMLGLDLNGAALYRHSHVFRFSQSTANNPPSSPSHRSVKTLQLKWREMETLADHKLVENAKAFWTEAMTDEYGKLALENLPFATEAERLAMRHLPRPVKGCRCMREDHEYVFDPNCMLYHDLRSRLSASELEEVLSLPNRAQKGKPSVAVPDDLNAVESAFTNRVLKLKQTTEKEEAEARFVARMEFMQVKELKKAIFAPCLSAIVLSTIFELQRVFSPRANRGTGNHGRNEEGDDDDEEDDMPLVSLGKRKSSAKQGQSNKRHTPNKERSPKFGFQYLTRMLQYISKTWGHCYREPSHEDYSWRWEVFHGNFSQSSDQRTGSSPPTNPRKPDSLPFENVRFGFVGHDGVQTGVDSLPAILNANQVAVSRQLETRRVPPILPVPSSNGSVPTGATASVGKKEGDGVAMTIPPLDIAPDVLDQYCTTIHLLSPACTGLYDELLALLKMEVIESKNGIPTLTQDWWSKIDNILLEDMDEYWSTQVDPDGKFCIHDELRDTLEEQWVKSESGWSMAEDRKTLIFELAALDEWRQSFEGQQEEKAKRKDGIGLFGL